MQIWNYHPVTSELLGSGSADPNPVEEGEWIIPAHATTIEPDAQQPGRAHVFTGGAWESVADHRGETWWKADAEFNNEPYLIGLLGDPVLQGFTKIEPPTPPPAPVAATPQQLFAALATALGKTPAEIDALVELAKTL